MKTSDFFSAFASKNSRPLFAVLALLLFPSPGLADDRRGGDDSLAVFSGIVTRTNFVDGMIMPWTNNLQDIGILGLAYSHRLGTLEDFSGNILPFGLGQDITVESELGVSARFGEEDLGEGWAALYLRYDDLPWNEHVYTTIAVNTGVSFLTELSEFERSRDDGNDASRILHYMGPEITFANPHDKDLELFLRYHHRSGVFGLFDGVVSGSTFISSGIRLRF